MGHRLTIAMTRWQATVNWEGGEPVTAELVVDTDSFEVLRGEGGVKGLSGPEKAVVRSNALKSLNASRFPEIRFSRRRHRQNRRRVSPQRDAADPGKVARARNRFAHRRSRRLVANVRRIHGSPIGLRHQAVLASDGVGAGRRRGGGVFHRGAPKITAVSPNRRRRRVCARAPSRSVVRSAPRAARPARRRGWRAAAPATWVGPPPAAPVAARLRRDGCFDGWCRRVHRVLRRSGSVVGNQLQAHGQ